ncbi:MAG TPA: hypothetical protein VGO43_11675 [Pyrinomonadaceae bacterium]|jgi:hypothetical protein|nr:hypothetical protein [Pyrinomonadaceae bacterium]
MKKIETDPTFNLPYEENQIRLKGIIGFAIGLVLLIVVTFGLMWALLNVLGDYNRENSPPANPLAMTDKERLPPEPRLQIAPGFGVDGPNGRVNLELTYPQSEYRELHKNWLELWERGQKDEKTGTDVVLPIDEAKEKVLASNIKVKSGTDPDLLAKSRMYVTDASAGRMAAEKRR